MVPDFENSVKNNSKKEVKPVLIEEELKKSFLDYAMSVIVSRAIPDVRDGLKPVHRRILYTMNQLGFHYNKPYHKSVRVVGEVLGKYHPHGDQAVYNTMVGMAQDFSKRYPLLDGQGNWGSIDGDSAAAMRYCIAGDSLILTDKGIIPIGLISDKKEDNINLKVVSYNKKINKASKFFDSGKQDIIRIITEQGYSISGSYNHPVLCWVRNEFGCPIIQWKLLEDIKEGDIVVLARDQNLFAKENFDLIKYHAAEKEGRDIVLPSKMTPSLAFLLGALVARGSTHQKQILFCHKNKSFFNKCKEAVLKNFKGLSFYKKGDSDSFSIHHQNIVDFLQSIGLRDKESSQKEIPFTVLRSKKDVISNFLRGLFECDGSIVFKKANGHNGNSIEIIYNSNSKKLLDQIKVVLLNFGIIAASQYKDERNGCYKLIISGMHNVYKFYKEIGFFTEEKQNILKQVIDLNKNRISETDLIPYLSEYFRKNYKISKARSCNVDTYNKLEDNYDMLKEFITPHDLLLINWLRQQNYFFNKVQKKDYLKAENVFSVKVKSDCHSYVANGFINHNTEVRMAKISQEILADLDKETVPFVSNFDGSTVEPVILPSRLPNILVNGTSGIAVGMASFIPPHNLGEVIDACLFYLKNPNMTEEELFGIIPAPDFPTGGIICGRAGIIKAYRTGRGNLILRAVIEIKERDKKGAAIIVKELPYQVNKADLIIKIANHVKNKVIEGIANIRDESDKRGMHLVIELKRGESPQVTLNQLYKYTDLQVSVSILMLGLLGNKPMIFTLYDLIHEFTAHRQIVVYKRTEYELGKAKAREHILSGFLIAIANIDQVVALIKRVDSAQEAIEKLNKQFLLTTEQSKAILEMKLQRLTGLEQEKIRIEIEELRKKIIYFKSILNDPNILKKVVIEELEEVKKNYSDLRKTKIEAPLDILSEEDLIPDEEVVVTLTRKGYIKRVPLDVYSLQRRGGKGKMGLAAASDSDDIVKDIFVTKNHDDLLFFTNFGRVYSLRVFEIAEASRTARGRAIVNLIPLNPGEKVVKLLCAKELDNHYIIMLTKKGIIKRTKSSSFMKIRVTGIRAIGLREDDELIFCSISKGKDSVVIATAKGQGIHFKEDEVRVMGRQASGVMGIRLKKDDWVVGMEVVTDENKDLLFVTEAGYGKKVKVADFRMAHRGGLGVRTIPTDKRNGFVVGLVLVDESSNILLIDTIGKIIRIAPKDIRTMKRQAKGLRLIKLEPGQKVVSVAVFSDEEDDI